MARFRYHEAQPAAGAFPAAAPRSPSPVLVPVQQALWLGISAAAMILALAVGAGFFSLVHLDADGPRMAPLSRYPWRAVGLVAAFGCPLLGLSVFGWHLWDRLRWDIREPMERHVLSLGDPPEAAAPARPATSYVLVNPPRRPAAEEAASAERERLAHFLRGCARDTSMAYWEPRIGREQYEAWRDLLLRASAARWKHPRAEDEPRYRKQGWSLAQAPTEILRRLG